jgi:membrane protein YqaA with SNARE-associated domain
VDAIDSSVGAWGLFVSAFVSATIAPGGSEAVLAFLVAQAEMPPGLLLMIATAGNTLGALTTWLLGGLAAIGWRTETVDRPRSEKAVASVRRWGVPILLFSWLPIVGDGLCFAGGWLKLPFLRSLVAIVIGKALRYAVVVFAFN